MTDAALKGLLDRKAAEYNDERFIASDPVSVPHRFSKKQDIEIAAFIAATLAWGNRRSIIQSATAIMQAMDSAPHDFLLHHREEDLKRFLSIVHLTFQATDLLYFIHRLSLHYRGEDSLESAFAVPGHPAASVRERLEHFHRWFFAPEHPERTRKHVSTPARGSACKRLNMFLRWMARRDGNGVDFGLWPGISPAALICPLDVHVGRVAWRLGLLEQNKADWKTAEALTERLRSFDADDPVKYDFALFGLGAEERVR